MKKSKRSGHKKSTAGCANCKKRHLKCDERRPSCVNCATQSRRCPYEDEIPQTATTPSLATNSTSGSLAGRHTSLNVVDRLQASSPAILLNIQGPSLDLTYVELLQQWLAETHRSYAYDDEHARIYGAMTLNQALAFPFLMHGILANAALHLSVKRPNKMSIYCRLASELSSQALAEFNSTLSVLDERSIIAAFLFSSITSAHQLCGCFLSAVTDFDQFIARFAECLKISRGVNIVIHGWWPFLQHSNLRPILTVLDRLKAEQDIDQQTPEFDEIRSLISSLDGVNSTNTTKIYLDSIQSLQKAFNVQSALGSPELNNSLSLLFAWPVNVSPELIPLLEMKRPEAILILAHYAPLLHHRRSSWAMGRAGVSMFELIESELGATWAKWLRWPRETMKLV